MNHKNLTISATNSNGCKSSSNASHGIMLEDSFMGLPGNPSLPPTPLFNQITQPQHDQYHGFMGPYIKYEDLSGTSRAAPVLESSVDKSIAQISPDLLTSSTCEFEPIMFSPHLVWSPYSSMTIAEHDYSMPMTYQASPNINTFSANQLHHASPQIHSHVPSTMLPTSLSDSHYHLAHPYNSYFYSQLSLRRSISRPEINPFTPNPGRPAGAPTARRRFSSASTKCVSNSTEYQKSSTSKTHTSSLEDGEAPKPFACTFPGCTKLFKRSEHLKRHLNTVHTEIKPYVCPFHPCQKRFSRSDNLNQHFRTHRPKVRKNSAQF